MTAAPSSTSSSPPSAIYPLVGLPSLAIKEPPLRLPRALLGAAIVAMTMLYFTADHFIGLPVLAILLLLSQFTNRRLGRGWALSMSLRVVALTVIAAAVGLPRTDLSHWYLKTEYTNPLGILLAAELTLRCWQYWTPARRRPFVVVSLVLTCLIFTCGCDTPDTDAAQRLSPVLLVLLALSLRAMNQMDLPVPATLKVEAGPPPRRWAQWRLEIIRGVVLAVVVAIGFCGVVLANRTDMPIDALLIRFSNHTRHVTSPVGMSGDPHLQASFGANNATSPVLLIDHCKDELYLRCAAFETFIDNRWTPTLENRTFRPMLDHQLQGEHAGQRITITRLTNVSDMLFLPLDCNGVEATGPLENDDDAGVHDKAAITNLPYDVYLSLPTAKGGVARYFPHQGPVAMPINDVTRAKLLALPPTVDPRVIALAKLVAGTGDAWTKALRLKMYLTSHHKYSLHFEPQGPDALNDFILNNRDAHCQYFASALAVMCRAVGIPARYVTGYYAHEDYGFGQMMVRSRDAHAWTEVLIDGLGWATLDATPASGMPEQLYPAVSSAFQWWERFLDIPRAFRAWITTRTTWQLFVAAAEVCGVLTVLWFLQHLWRRRRAPRKRRRIAAADSLEAAALRFDAWLTRHGIACPIGATWRDCVASPSAPRDVIAVRSRCDEFLQAYDTARFGPATLAEQLKPRVNSLLDVLEHSEHNSPTNTYAKI